MADPGDTGLAAALLLDLAEAEVIVADGKNLVTVPDAVVEQPLLAATLQLMVESAKPRPADRWLYTFARKLRPLPAKVGEALVTRGVLNERRGKVLGLFPTTAWPELDPAPEEALRERLVSALERGTEPDPHTALLISLLGPLDLVVKVVDKEHRKAAERRAKEIAETEVEQLVSKALARALTDLNTVFIAASGTT